MQIETTAGTYQIRPVAARDNAAVATIIRQVMTEFGCVGAGYSIEDPEVDNMTDAYADNRSAFFVLEHEGTIHGVAGIAPLSNAETNTCELRKMYFLPTIRGLGLGRALLAHCLHTATRLGFTYCYLETVNRMTDAARLYQAAGFVPLPGPLGNTGHSSCDHFYGMALPD